jgi:glucan 1,3-beta-glucosidase
MDDFQMDVAYRGYAAAQLITFEKYLGWFFWSYKTETAAAWSFRDCVERGWLPDMFG